MVSYRNSIFTYLSSLLLLTAVVLLPACANRIAPSGGIKDTTPPRVLISSPPNKTTSFKGNSITLLFDEFITLQNPEQQVIISPYMSQLPLFKLKGKTLVIAFQQALLDSTTYNINFGNSLRDLTEANPLTAYNITFSTGKQLDTLQMSGLVQQAATNQAAEAALVLLYPANAPDSAVRTQPPLYAARSNKQGKFVLNGLPQQAYRVYALNDKNNNYYYDQATEDIAFLPTTIRPQATTDTTAKPALVLRLFNEQKGAAILGERSNREYGRIQLGYSQAIDSMQISILNKQFSFEQILPEITPDHDTINLWYRDISPDQAFKFAITGSRQLADTIEYVRTAARRTLEALAFTSSINIGRGDAFIAPDVQAWIQFNHPISQWNLRKIQLIADKKDITPPQFVTQSADYPRRFLINYTWKPDVKYQLIVPDSTFTDYFGQHNLEIDLSFTTAPPQRFGSLRLSLKGAQPNTTYLYQLYKMQGDALTKSGTVLPNATATIEYVRPETYYMVIVQDSNANGKWDTGKLDEQLQPETIFATEPNIQVKSLWDTEVVIDVTGNTKK